MEEKYEYHKQNDYPGERTAEKKRVADREEAADVKSDARVAEKGRIDELRADNRVARRGRMDDQLMDAEIQRSTARAERVDRERNASNTLGTMIIIGLLVVLIVGFGWGLMSLRQQANEIDSLNMQIANSANAPVSTSSGIVFLAADTEIPTIVKVSPTNNEFRVETHDAVIVQFSKPMDASTINENTFIVMQRTTPAADSPSAAYRTIQVEGTITYNGLTAVFVPKDSGTYNPLQPSQKYGNVFTATITTGAKDLSGKSLVRNYVWSFSTGGGLFNTDVTTSQVA